MNSRERFLAALKHRVSDRVPTFTNFTPRVAEKLGRKMDLPWKAESSWLSDRISYTQILLTLGNDAVRVGPLRPNDAPTRREDDALIDEFGFRYTKAGSYNEITERPLAHAETLEDIAVFKMPEPLAPGRWYLAKKQIKRYKNDYAIIGDLETTIFELSWNLVGMEKFFMDLIMEKSYVFALLDKVLEYHLTCGKKMVELGVDMIWTGDDFGTQRGMIIAPQIWRRIFKPRMRYVIQQLKEQNPEIKIAYHSCGSILPIIPDLIEIGVDVLNPIQPQAKDMDLGRLKEEFGDKLIFFVGVDEQRVLPFGNTEGVVQEVKLRIAQAGKSGGFIIAPSHNIQPYTPLENIYAYFETIKKYGTYPLNS